MGFAAQLAAADAATVKHLGGALSYAPTVGAPVSPEGVFDAAHAQVDAGQPGVSSTGPAVFFRLADLPSDPEADTGATITAAGVQYRAWKVEKDGQGGVLLRLHRAT